jgi:phytoene synthase
MFLPREKRDATHAVYAFSRMIVDAIDQPSSQDGPGGCSGDSLTGRIAMFGEKLTEIYDQRLELPNAQFRSTDQHVLHAISLTIHRYEIPRHHFLDLAEGCRMRQTVSRYATWNSLEKYLHLTGGAAARAVCCVLGVTHSDAAEQIAKLGIAMQLTTILRDIKQDRDRGRIYLPLEDLARFRYSEKDLATGTVNEQFRELMRFEIARARQLYRDGAQGICWLAGDGSRMAASVLTVLHSGVLKAIDRQDYDVFRRITCLSRLQKLACLPRAWRIARREADEPPPTLL